MAEHLSDETLARLADGRPNPTERAHLASCPACAAALRAFRDQTEALSALPVLRPPRGEWTEVEARLRAEGLIRTEGSAHAEAAIRRVEPTRSRTPASGSRALRPGRSPASDGPLSSSPWLAAAAAVVLFLGGGVAGAALRGESGAGVTAADDLGPTATVADAADAVRVAEERYIQAFLRYRQLSGDAEVDVDQPDASARYAALDALLTASRQAVREAPADPFLNGVLVSTLAERQATLRRISTDDDEWY